MYDAVIINEAVLITTSTTGQQYDVAQTAIAMGAWIRLTRQSVKVNHPTFDDYANLTAFIERLTI